MNISTLPMVAITEAVLSKSSCGSCGALGGWTYSPLNHVFICWQCHAECEMPVLPPDMVAGKQSE